MGTDTSVGGDAIASMVAGAGRGVRGEASACDSGRGVETGAGDGDFNESGRSVVWGSDEIMVSTISIKAKDEHCCAAI